MIPAYNALHDPHCGVARGKQTQHRLSATAGKPELQGRKSKSGEAREAAVVRSIGSATSGVTFQRPTGTDPNKEVEVLKCIVLRENYLARLKQLANRPIAAHQDGFSDLVELTRTVTLETIDSVSRWKRGAPPGSQFIWNGVNYLLRIPSDLDFLDKSAAVRAWVGASMERNPFMIGRTLEQSPAAGGDGGGASREKSSRRPSSPGNKRRRTGSGGGGGRRASSSSKSRGAPSESRSAGGRRSSAYLTPVLNDPEMRLSKNIPASPQAEQRRAQLQKKRRALEQDGEAITAPHEEVDMIRILEGERLLLQEEAMHGQFTRNEIGLLVPAAVGKDADNVHGSKTRAMPPSKKRALPPPPQGVELSEAAREKGADRRNWRNGRYIQEKAKQAGDLAPLHKRRTFGKRQVPVRRSRAAKIELEIRRAKVETQSLEEDLLSLKASLERAKEDLAVMEAEEKQEALMSIPASADPAKRDRDRLVKASYVHKTEQEVARRQSELEHKKSVLKRKQSAREEFRELQRKDQLRLREETIAKKRRHASQFADQVDTDPADEQQQQQQQGVFVDAPPPHLVQPEPELAPAVRPEGVAATQIQRIVRGGLGRARFVRVFFERPGAALRIQAFRRMICGGRRWRLVREQRDKCVLIQSFLRGCASRRRVAAIRLARLRVQSAVTIQSAYRRFRGACRSRNKRILLEDGALCVSMSNAVYASDLLELAKVKADEIEPNVLSLVQCCLIITARGTRQPAKAVERLMNWKACKRALRRPFLLAKIKALATSARHCAMFLHPDRVTAVQRHLHDPNLTSKALARVKCGARVCQNLLQWMNALLRCMSTIPDFLEPGADRCEQWLAVLAADDPSGLELWEPSDLDYDSDKIDPERYVSEDVLRCRLTRPRPLLVAIAQDVPAGARDELRERLKRTLPGTFAHVGHEGFDMATLQQVLDGGLSVLLDVDIGVAAKQRDSFLRRIAVARSTLRPRPLFVLVKGSAKNRGRRGVARAAVLGDISGSGNGRGAGGDDFGGLHSNLPSSMLVEEETYTGAEAEGMADGALKAFLEDRNSSEFLLATPSSRRQLRELARVSQPAEAVVLLMEAIMVLLTPGNNYSGPGGLVGSVSWEQARVLLDLEQDGLARRLAAVDAEAVPPDNLLALQEYIAHPKFPRLEDSAPLRPIVRILLWWAHSTIQYAAGLQESGGPADKLSKGTSDVFAAVITVEDGITRLPVEYEPRQDRWPARRNGDLCLQSDGARVSFVKLLQVALRDVKVFSASVKVPVHASPLSHLAPASKLERDNDHARKLLIVSIHRDPLAEAFFFIGYDPATSAEYYHVVPDAGINRLLGPNSIEMRDPRKPPRNDIELYRRLLELVALERPQQRIVGAPALPYRLILRRTKRRLLRGVRKIDSQVATVTASEAAPGEIVVDAYVASTSKTYQLTVSDEVIRRICRSSSSEREKRDLRSKDGTKMVLHLTDRLTFRRATSAGAVELAVQHGVVPGRKVFEGSVVISHHKHLVSVNVSSATKALRVVTYLPSTSFRSEFLLSATARLRLLGSLNEGQRSEWLSRLFGRLHLHRPASVNEFGRTMSGSSEASQAEERIVVLDKSLFKLSQRVPTGEDDAESRLLLVEFCVSGDAILIRGQDDDDFYEDDLADETRLANYRRTSDRGVLDVLAYDKVNGSRFKLELSEPQLELLLAPAGEARPFQADEESLRALAGLLRLEGAAGELKLVAAKDGTVIQDAKTCIPTRGSPKVPAQVREEESRPAKVVSEPEPGPEQEPGLEQRTAPDTVAEPVAERPDPSGTSLDALDALEKAHQEAAVPAEPAGPTPTPLPLRMAALPPVISAEIEVVNLDVARSVPVAAPSSKPPGQLAYKHGHKIGGESGRYVVFSVWAQDAPSEDQGNRYKALAGTKPAHGLVLEAYDPALRQYARLELLTHDALRAAVGGRQDLLAPDRLQELIAYLLARRLFVECKAQQLTLCVAQSKLFGLDKVTPINKNEVLDQLRNDENEDIVILADGDHEAAARRGTKLLSAGQHVPLVHTSSAELAEFVVVTVFEIGEADLYAEQGSGRAPLLRIYAYNPAVQTNIKLELSAPDLFEALDGRYQLLDVLRRKEMVRALLPMLRIERSLDARVPDRLTLPWKAIRQERLFCPPAPFSRDDPDSNKLFTRGLHSSNGLPIIATAQLVRPSDGSLVLWFQIYDPALGQRCFVRVPKAPQTEDLLQLCAVGASRLAAVQEAALELLRKRLYVVRLRRPGQEEQVMRAYLLGLVVQADVPDSQTAAALSEAQEGFSEAAAAPAPSDPHAAARATAPHRERLFLLPSTACRRQLARRVAKISGLYAVVTVHELVDELDPAQLRGLHVRAYCPSVSQQASANVPLASTDIDLPALASDLVAGVSLDFDGVEGHMVLLLPGM